MIDVGCQWSGRRSRRRGHPPLLRGDPRSCEAGVTATAGAALEAATVPAAEAAVGGAGARGATGEGGNARALPARCGPGPHRTSASRGPGCAQGRRDRRPGHCDPGRIDGLACRLAHHETLTGTRLVGPRGNFCFRPGNEAVAHGRPRRVRCGHRRRGTRPLAGWRARRALGPTGSPWSCRHRGRGGGRRGRFLGLNGATQPFPVGLAPGAVGLRVFDRRRVALHADPEVDANVQGFLVGQPQLTGKLVDADFLGQLVIRSSPIEGQRSVRDPEAGAALHSHTTPGTRTPVHPS